MIDLDKIDTAFDELEKERQASHDVVDVDVEEVWRVKYTALMSWIRLTRVLLPPCF